VQVENDILDLIRDLPSEINDASTTTEMKFLTVGGVLWACHDEIRRLRQEIQELRNARPKSKNLHGMQKNIPKS
jgi:hypothetical protein